MAMMETTGNASAMTAMSKTRQYGSELNFKLTTDISDEERDDLGRLLVVEQKIKPPTTPTPQLLSNIKVPMVQTTQPLSNIKAPTTIPRTHLLSKHQKLCPFLTALKGFLLCKYTSNY